MPTRVSNSEKKQTDGWQKWMTIHRNTKNIWQLTRLVKISISTLPRKERTLENALLPSVNFNVRKVWATHQQGPGSRNQWYSEIWWVPWEWQAWHQVRQPPVRGGRGIQYKYKTKDDPKSPNLNVVVAFFATCWARVGFYDAVGQLQELVQHNDTEGSSPPLFLANQIYPLIIFSESLKTSLVYEKLVVDSTTFTMYSFVYESLTHYDTDIKNMLVDLWTQSGNVFERVTNRVRICRTCT